MPDRPAPFPSAASGAQFAPRQQFAFECDPDTAHRTDAAHVLRHVRDVLDLAADHLEIALAGFGQRNVAAHLGRQRGADVQRKRLYLLADGGRGM